MKNKIIITTVLVLALTGSAAGQDVIETQTFSTAGTSTTYTLPQSADSINVTIKGGQGGDGGDDSSEGYNGGTGGQGATAKFEYKGVTGGTTLDIGIGEAGSDGSTNNDGGAGGGEGGSSAIRYNTNSSLIACAGGGGGASGGDPEADPSGGDGGNNDGQDGDDQYGQSGNGGSGGIGFWSGCGGGGAGKDATINNNGGDGDPGTMDYLINDYKEYSTGTNTGDGSITIEAVDYNSAPQFNSDSTTPSDWKFGDQPGFNVNVSDSDLDGGTAQNGTYQGETLHNGQINGATWTDAKKGYGLDFDGNSDIVTVSDAPELDVDKFSVTFTMKPRSDGSNDFGRIFHRENAYNAQVASGDDLKFILNFEDGSKNTLGHGSFGGFDKTYDVALTYDGSKQRIYFNDTEVAESPVLGKEINAVSNVLGIGSEPSGGSHFDGKIYNFRLYNQSLTSSQVSEIHNSNKFIREDLIAYWRFDKGSGGTAYDTHHRVSQYNSNNVGGTDALSFDGVDDGLNLGDVEDPTGSIAISGKLKSPNSADTADVIVSSHRAFDDANTGFILREGNFLIGNSNDGLVDHFYNTGGAFDGSIHDFTLNFKANNQVEWYVDGDLKDTISTSYSIQETGHKLGIGYQPEGAKRHSDITLYDIKIYNNSLSSSQIQSNNNGDVVQDGLLYWYAFDNATGRYADSRGLNVLDYSILPSVKLDVLEDGQSIVNDAYLELESWFDVWNGGHTYTIENAFTIDESNVFYNASLTAIDELGDTRILTRSQFISDNQEFSILKPENKLYNSQVSWEVSTNDTDDVVGESLDIKVKSDGVLKDSVSVLEGNSVSGSFTEVDGNHTLKVILEEQDGDTEEKTVDYETDSSAPVIDIKNPSGSTSNLTGLELNYVVSDSNLDSSSCTYSKDGGTNFSISNCENTTVGFGSVGNHSLTVYASDKLNNSGSDSVEFFVDNVNEVTAETLVSGSTINEFSVSLKNSSYSIGGSTSNGEFDFNTSNMPKGTVDVVVREEGFKVGTKTLNNVDSGFDQDLNFKLERAGFEAKVYDEQTGNKLFKPVILEIKNSSSSKEVAWGNIYSSDTGGLDSPRNVFDADKTSDASISNNCNTNGCGGSSSVSVTGFVSLKDTASEEIQVKFDGTPLSNGDEGYLSKVEAIKNGNWETIWSGTDRSNTKVRNFSIDNSEGEYSGRVRISGGIDWAEDYNAAELEIFEVWSNNLKAPSFQYPNYPTGEVDILVDDNADDEYRQRKYLADLDENAKVTLDAFLLRDGEGILTTVETRSSDNDPLKNSVLNIQRSLDGSFKTVAQGETSSDGSASFYLDPDTTYQVVATHPGYESFTGTFNPANYQYDPLLIRLGEANNFTESTEWDRVEYKLLPDQSSLNSSGVYTFNWSVIDSESGITEFGIKVRDGGGSLLDSKSVSGSPSGGTAVLSFNNSNYNFVQGSELEVTGYFVKDQTEFQYRKTYTIVERVQAGLYSLKSLMSTFGSQSGSTARSFVALIVTLVVGTGLKSRFNRTGGGILTLVVLGGFTWRGWFSGFFWILTVLTLVGLYGRRG